MQGRGSVRRSGSQLVRLVFDEQVNELEVSVGAGDDERRRAVLSRQVNVSAWLDKEKTSVAQDFRIQVPKY